MDFQNSLLAHIDSVFGYVHRWCALLYSNLATNAALEPRIDDIQASKQPRPNEDTSGIVGQTLQQLIEEHQTSNWGKAETGMDLDNHDNKPHSGSDHNWSPQDQTAMPT